MTLSTRGATSAPPSPRSAAWCTAVLALTLLLTGCDPDGDAGPPPGPRQTSPAQSPGPPFPPTGPAATPAPDGLWGTYPNRDAACLAVTDDVFFLAQLPPDLGAVDGAGDLDEVNSRLAFMEEQGPPELRGHYARLRTALEAQDPATPSKDPSREPTVAPPSGTGQQELPQLSSKVERLSSQLRGWLEGVCR